MSSRLLADCLYAGVPLVLGIVFTLKHRRALKKPPQLLGEPPDPYRQPGTKWIGPMMIAFGVVMILKALLRLGP